MRIEIRTDGQKPTVVIKKRRGKGALVPMATGEGPRKGDQVSKEMFEQLLTDARELAPGKKLQ